MPLSPFAIKNNDEMLMSPNSIMRKTFRDRTFSKMGPGSVRGSIFALCSSSIGTGVLSLPYVLALNGYVFGIVFIIISAIAAQISNNILAKRACENEMANYNQLCLLCGGKSMANFLSSIIFIYVIGTLISY